MIFLKQTLLNSVTESAIKSYPHETCGLLGGKGNLLGNLNVTRVKFCENVSESSTKTSFQVDPRDRFSFMRELQNTNELIVGHYHSHPDQIAEPSARDLKMAFEPNLIWLIISLSNTEIIQVKAHKINVDPSGFEEIPIQLI